MKNNKANYQGLKFGDADIFCVYAAGLGQRCFAFQLTQPTLGIPTFHIDVITSFSRMKDLEALVKEKGFTSPPREICILDVRDSDIS